MLKNADASDNGTLKAAYDYHATVVATRTKQQVTKCCPPFGEQLTLAEPTDKVTENFTGKGIRGERCDSRVYSIWLCRAEEHCAQRNERDDEIELNYFGARYLDPMLGLWTSVDPARQFASPYLYAGNGMNPMNGVDPSGSFYDDGERCSEFDPLVNNGSVSPSELDHLVKVSRNLQSSPGVENTIMSLAKYSYFNDVETSFWYDNEGQNTFNYGTRTDVKPLGGHGNYFHFHTWRSVNSWAYEGLSYVITSDGKVEGDIPWANQYEKSTMGLEVRSGKLFYYSPKLNKNYQYIIGRYPTWDIDAYQNVQDFDRSLFPQKN